MATEPIAARPQAWLVAEAGGQAEAVSEVLSQAAQAAGWDYAWTQESAPGTVQALAERGAALIVVAGPELEAQALEAAGQFPGAYFISLRAPGAGPAAPPPNMLALGGPGTRHDQAGFLAGMAAGLATQSSFVVAAGDPATLEGRLQRNGFLHGVRYTCPRCRVDFMDIDEAAPAEAEALQRAVKIYRSGGADVVFAAPGPAGGQVLRIAAQAGAWVIGSGEDVYLTLFETSSAPGAERVLASVLLDPRPALARALEAFRQGAPLSGERPLSAAEGALGLAPYRDPDGALSALDRQDIAAALARLADGSLETGIDFLSGEEK